MEAPEVGAPGWAARASEMTDELRIMQVPEGHRNSQGLQRDVPGALGGRERDGARGPNGAVKHDPTGLASTSEVTRRGAFGVMA